MHMKNLINTFLFLGILLQNSLFSLGAFALKVQKIPPFSDDQIALSYINALEGVVETKTIEEQISSVTKELVAAGLSVAHIENSLRIYFKKNETESYNEVMSVTEVKDYSNGMLDAILPVLQSNTATGLSWAPSCSKRNTVIAMGAIAVLGGIGAALIYSSSKKDFNSVAVDSPHYQNQLSMFQEDKSLAVNIAAFSGIIGVFAIAATASGQAKCATHSRSRSLSRAGLRGNRNDQSNYYSHGPINPRTMPLNNQRGLR